MALTTNTIKEFQDYLGGVVARASHHAPNVTECIYVLAGLIILKGTDIKVREYNGQPANMLWVTINSKQYAFRYEHNNGTIEIRDGGQNSPILHAIDNSKTTKDIMTIFNTL